MPPEPLTRDHVRAGRRAGAPALAALDRGGTLAVAGIYLSDIPSLNYQKHLFQERQLRSVTSNTRADAREFLGIAAEHHLAVTVHPYPLDAAGPVRLAWPPTWPPALARRTRVPTGAPRVRSSAVRATLDTGKPGKGATVVDMKLEVGRALPGRMSFR